MVSLSEREFRLSLAALALVAGVTVVVIAVELFPYHSVNHDEAVYLQQAAMLLEGSLRLTPEVPGAVRPWFFVRDGAALYPKYQPGVPAMFAPGVALGAPRLVLGVVAAGNVALVGLLGRAAFDRPTGLLAAGFALLTPFFLFTSATFLPYAPTTLLNLGFAYAYVRALRGASLPWAVAAGVLVGWAALARPYTAAVFALPFVGHAGLVLFGRLRELRTDSVDLPPLRPPVAQLAVVAALGLLAVLATFAYNRAVTGDPLLFPFQAFDPDDTIGFGERAVLGHEVDYTVGLAIRSTRRLLWETATRWTVAAPLGTLLALVGLVPALRGGTGGPAARLPERALRRLILAVAPVVVAAAVPFWGTYNVLARLDDPTDGFIAEFGPFYQFDLLLPLSVLGAAGTLWLGRRLYRGLRDRRSRRVATVAVVAALLVGFPVAGTLQAAALGPPTEEHLTQTRNYKAAQQPVVDHEFDRAVVFVPTPYGDWLSHPFQRLRNGGSVDGPVVYALDRSAGEDFAVIDAYPERQPYRFTYRGEWTPEGEPVRAHVEPLTVREGASHTVTTDVGVVGSPSTVRLSAGDGSLTRRIDDRSPGDRLTVRWRVNTSVASLVSVDGAPAEGSVDLDGPDTVVLQVTFVQPGGATVTYEQDLETLIEGESIRATWPPETRVCRLTTDCGYGGTVVPGGEYLDGVAINTTVRTRD
jgi:hypothetical protein